MAQQLKAFIVLYNGKFIRVYPENKVNNVLAEKDAEIAELKIKLKVQTSDAEAARKLNTSYLIDYAEALKRESHHKYKLCLAKAKWCERKRIDAADYRIPRRKWEFYDKWHKRWLELAEKFKEAK